jgi:TPR repeat protein
MNDYANDNLARQERNVMPAWPLLLLFLTLPAAASEQDVASADAAIKAGDLITGMNLLRSAAAAGFAPAQARYGEILDKAEEDKEAVIWYRKAAEQGNAAGEFGLGMQYASGEGLPKDMQRALEWVRRAAEQGNQSAVETLAMAYRSGGLGLQADTAEAARWAAKAAAIRAADPRQALVKQVDKRKERK